MNTKSIQGKNLPKPRHVCPKPCNAEDQTQDRLDMQRAMLTA